MTKRDSVYMKAAMCVYFLVSVMAGYAVFRVNFMVIEGNLGALGASLLASFVILALAPLIPILGMAYSASYRSWRVAVKTHITTVMILGALVVGGAYPEWATTPPLPDYAQGILDGK